MSAPFAAAATNAEKDAKVRDWIARNISPTIVRFEQQPRWRGGWWVDVEKDGKRIPLYVREEREEDYPPWPLEHEAGALQVLERHGVPVPHVWGMIDDPHATVMDALPGHCDFSTVSEAERVAVLEAFAEAVARQHAIPPQDLADALGLKLPETPEDISLGCFRICEEMYLKGKKLPEPRVEFLRQWVYRNIPRHRSRVSVLAVDSGQFLFQDGRITGLYDFEYASLGDPLIDVAFIPLRLSMHNAGDVSPFFRRYAELTGDRLELDVLAFHAVWWGMCTPFILTPDLHAPGPRAKYFEYAGWYMGAIISQMEVLADAKGIDLSNRMDIPPARPSRWAQMIDVMAARLPEADPAEPYAVTEQRKVLTFIQRADGHRDIEAQYFADVEALTGRAVQDWLEADTVLERFVLAAGPEHDEALIRLFHSWAVTQARTFLPGLAHMPMFDSHWPKLSRLVAAANEARP
ncbi:MAG TPA: phosphotransferase [Novosphingobium sp.]|nr:phosphotransferase [Novosphingobium sp.]